MCSRWGFVVVEPGRQPACTFEVGRLQWLGAVVGNAAAQWSGEGHVQLAIVQGHMGGIPVELHSQSPPAQPAAPPAAVGAAHLRETEAAAALPAATNLAHNVGHSLGRQAATLRGVCPSGVLLGRSGRGRLGLHVGCTEEGSRREQAGWWEGCLLSTACGSTT